MCYLWYSLKQLLQFMMTATAAIAVLHDDDHSNTDSDITISDAMFLLHLIWTIKKPIVPIVKI